MSRAWVRRITVVAVFGGALAEVPLLFGLYPAAHDALVKLVALIVHLFLVTIVLQCRRSVAARIRDLAEAGGSLAVLRNWLARVWHYIAIFYIIGYGWFGRSASETAIPACCAFASSQSSWRSWRGWSRSWRWAPLSVSSG
jgi:hypothetical protein